MKVSDYLFYGDKTQNLKFNSEKTVNLGREDNHIPLPVAIGIDASTSITGVTIGLIDKDEPFVFLEFQREKGESIFSYLTALIDGLSYRVIMNNNLRVEYIFIEDKYEDKTKYSKASADSLATVKTVMKDLPSKISECTGFQKPKYVLLQPQSWRKYYLGDLNTNKGRDFMKNLVAEYGVKKYSLHPQAKFFTDCTDSIGIYSAGIISVVKPEDKTNMIAEVIPNEVEWSHTLNIKVVYSVIHKDAVSDVIYGDKVIKERVEKYGFKMFEYYRGISLEKNLRSLTSNSNAIFICVLRRDDMEVLPICYEFGKVPENNEMVICIGYRENIKGGVK